MRHTLFILLIASMSLTACDNREQKLRKKEIALAQKEQELLLKEKELELRELELSTIKTPPQDSLTTDSITKNTALIGTWSVKMVCTQTDCEGSAIGDTKNEQWELSYQNNTLLAKAYANNKLVRVYSGKQNGKIYELAAEQNPSESESPAKMLVKLKMVSDKKLEGQREIFREKCRIIYSLDLNKQ